MEKDLQQEPSTCLKVVLFGPESTGKTTLAKALAAHYEVPWVPEFMREYAQKKFDSTQNSLEREDVLPIAKGQMTAENEAAKRTDSFLICDTNLLEIKVYSEYYFDGFCPPSLAKYAEANQYTLYLLASIDVPWEQDDLRDRPQDRLALFHTFEQELIVRKLPYEVISGAHDVRLKKACEILDKLL